MGEEVENLAFETGTVLTPALSPAHYWEKALTESGMFIAALETIDESDHPALRTEMIETIKQFFDGSRNAVPMEYRLTTATVR